MGLPGIRFVETWRMLEPRIILFIIFGAAIAGILLFEKRLEGKWISIPMIYVAVGWLLFSMPLDLGWLTPAFDAEHTLVVEYISELIVIVSLMSLGLSIDRKFELGRLEAGHASASGNHATVHCSYRVCSVGG